VDFFGRFFPMYQSALYHTPENEKMPVHLSLDSRMLFGPRQISPSFPWSGVGNLG